MRRLHLFEFEDQKWFPEIFRNHLTGVMRYANNLLYIHSAVLPLIKEALTHIKDKRIIDLCSGATGPWDKLHKEIAKTLGPVSLSLTDKYPNREICRMWSKVNDKSAGKIEYIAESIDARNVPENLQGMRTLFSGLHHFKVDEVRGILKAAVDKNTAIGVFEFTESRRWALARLLVSPLFVWIATPSLRPVIFASYFWTYIIPIIPFVFLWDAVVSYFRMYSIEELETFTKELKRNGYIWKVGSCHHTNPTCPIKITYLLGYPDKIKKPLNA